MFVGRLWAGGDIAITLDVLEDLGKALGMTLLELCPDLAMRMAHSAGLVGPTVREPTSTDETHRLVAANELAAAAMNLPREKIVEAIGYVKTRAAKHAAPLGQRSVRAGLPMVRSRILSPDEAAALDEEL